MIKSTKLIKSLVVVSLFLFLNLNVISYAADTQTIVLMRHGEKPLWNLGQLNCQGLNRALALIKVLDARYGKPDYIFAPSLSLTLDKHKLYYFYYARGLAAIEPTAIHFAMPVNTKYHFVEYARVAEELINQKYHNSMIFISWEHANLVAIAKEILKKLKVDNKVVPKWSQNDFDSLYVINIDWRAKSPSVHFMHQHQGLNQQNKNCPGEKILVSPDAGEKKVIFVPEAETYNSIDQLNDAGLKRALALPNILAKIQPQVDYFVVQPQAQLTNNDTTHFTSTFMTIEPSVIKYNKFLLFTGLKTNNTFLAQQLTASSLDNKKIVVAWPYEKLADLAQAYFKANGGDPKLIPNPIKDHDTFYQITVKKSGTVFQQFTIRP